MQPITMLMMNQQLQPAFLINTATKTAIKEELMERSLSFLTLVLTYP
jgi:hypothetical protein